MTEKKKCAKGGAAKLAQKGMDELGNIVDMLAGMVPDSAKSAAGRSKCASARSAREVVKLERKLFKSTLGLLEKVEKRTGKMVESALTENDKLPAEARGVAKEWSRVLRVGRDELKTAVEKSFDLVDQYLAKAEKAAKKPAAKKPAAKKAPAKKAPAKKAPAKKPAAKKKAAEKKATPPAAEPAS